MRKTHPTSEPQKKGGETIINRSLKEKTAADYQKRVCRAMNFISQNIDRELNLEEIAKASAFSMFHFHRIFKAVVGEGVAEFTRRLRLELAASHLVSKKNQDITTIAMDLGFSSSQNFSKAFRKYFGTTPSNFRNSSNERVKGKGKKVLSAEGLDVSDIALTLPIQKEQILTVKASIQNMPAYHVAYVRKMGPYGKETCEAAFEALMKWASPKGYKSSGVLLGLYWDNPDVTPPEKCRVDACISISGKTVLEGPIGIQKISGGPYAVCQFEIGPENFQNAWDEAFFWFVHQGLECADTPCYERYHNDASEHPEGKWIVDISIPLKQ